MPKNVCFAQSAPSSLSVRLAWRTGRTKGVRRGQKGSVMMFLLRMAFWLSVVVLLVPTGKVQPTGAASSVSAAEAVSAAGAAVADMRHFCERQAEACTVGAQAAVTFGQKAQAGAK